MKNMQHMTKGDLALLAYGEQSTSGVDFSLPQAVFDDLMRLDIDTSFYVWSYKEEDCGKRRGGVLVNLLEKCYKRGILRSA